MRLSLDDIINHYGNPNAPNFERDHIVAFDLPFPFRYGAVESADGTMRSLIVHRSRCHKLAVKPFLEALERIKSRDLIGYALAYGGIYNLRSIRGHEGILSSHAWGCAIDINPAENALSTNGTMSPEIVACFAESGFTWGGDFKSRKDPMHFSLLGF